MSILPKLCQTEVTTGGFVSARCKTKNGNQGGLHDYNANTLLQNIQTHYQAWQSRKNTLTNSPSKAASVVALAGGADRSNDKHMIAVLEAASLPGTGARRTHLTIKAAQKRQLVFLLINIHR